MKVDLVPMPLLGRSVYLRPGTSDAQVLADTQWRNGAYHRPPATLPPPARVLDVGANIGLTAADYQALWPGAQVVAVEMDVECVALARRNNNGNGVAVRHHAVSGRGGWGSYNPSGRAEAYRFEPDPVPGPGVRHVRYGNDKRVQSYTLGETIVRAFGEGATVDFCKLDVEGAEWGIFHAGLEWAPLVRYLLVELHPGEARGVTYPDDSTILVHKARSWLGTLGFWTEPHTAHPRAVWAWR